MATNMNPANDGLVPKPILAMWSGPRNLSTAMMRSWENRPDTQVWDEPFYAAYLERTGLQHPMREAILAAHEADLSRVIAQCSTPAPSGFFYQKQMTHHILPDYPLAWLAGLRHCFLLRDPQRVLLSYARKHDEVSLADIGVPQQWRLYQWVRDHVGEPLVIDAEDFLTQPEAYLRALCAYCEIPFYAEMLHWPAGRRESDGVWAAHWYDAVWKSTGFTPWPPSSGVLPARLQAIYAQAEPIYRRLYERRLVILGD